MRRLFGRLGGFGVTLALGLGATAGLTACDRPGARAAAPLAAGTYAVQNVQYNDATGIYRVTVLGAAPGVAPYFESAELKMARLTDDKLAAGQTSQLEVAAGDATLWLTPDFQVAYVHNVTEEQMNPATGRP